MSTCAKGSKGRECWDVFISFFFPLSVRPCLSPLFSRVLRHRGFSAPHSSSSSSSSSSYVDEVVLGVGPSPPNDEINSIFYAFGSIAGSASSSLPSYNPVASRKFILTCISDLFDTVKLFRFILLCNQLLQKLYQLFNNCIHRIRGTDAVYIFVTVKLEFYIENCRLHETAVAEGAGTVMRNCREKNNERFLEVRPTE